MMAPALLFLLFFGMLLPWQLAAGIVVTALAFFLAWPWLRE
jgi:hypothetical protein